MDDIVAYLKVKRNLINLLVLGIMVLGIPIGVELIHRQQQLNSQAAVKPIEVVSDSKCITTRNGLLVTKCADIKLRLTSPLGGPAEAGASVAPTASP